MNSSPKRLWDGLKPRDTERKLTEFHENVNLTQKATQLIYSLRQWGLIS